MDDHDAQQANQASEHEELRVSRENDGMRLDSFIVDQGTGHSRAFIQKCIRQDLFRLNNQAAKPSDTVRTNDLVTLVWPERPAQRKLQAIETPFDILYEDDDILVINKPPGLIVHPAEHARGRTLVHGLLYYDPEAFEKQLGPDERPGIVHRLDKDTSGAMVIAKNREAHGKLKAAFKDRAVEKTYLTIAIGEFGRVTGRIENLIGRHPKNRRKMSVVEENGKIAATRYRVLASTEDFSLLAVRIETGRTHQIRVHLSNLYHPVLGDEVYGGKQRELNIDVPRQMLHAWKLAFPHPSTGVMREYTAPLHDDFKQVLAQLGLPVIGEKTRE